MRAQFIVLESPKAQVGACGEKRREPFGSVVLCDGVPRYRGLHPSWCGRVGFAAVRARSVEFLFDALRVTRWWNGRFGWTARVVTSDFEQLGGAGGTVAAPEGGTEGPRRGEGAASGGCW